MKASLLRLWAPLLFLCVVMTGCGNQAADSGSNTVRENPEMTKRFNNEAGKAPGGPPPGAEAPAGQ